MRRSSFLIASAAVTVSLGTLPARAQTGGLVLMCPLNSDNPMGEIVKAFAAKHGAAVRPFFGRPDALASQLEAGAPCDVFVASSADMEATLSQKGLVEAWKPLCKLVPTIIVGKGNAQHITTIGDLAKHGVKLSVGDDATPIGKFTHALVKRATKEYGADFESRFFANVASRGVNSKAVTGQVNNGTADAGIVFTSDVVGDEVGRVEEVAIPAALAGAIANQIAVVKASANQAAAKSFIEFATGAEAAAIFRRYRFA
jgi:molybdate transport system substrate-binding protein